MHLLSPRQRDWERKAVTTYQFRFLSNSSGTIRTWEIYGWCGWAFYIAAMQAIGMGAGNLKGSEMTSTCNDENRKVTKFKKLTASMTSL